MTRRIFAMLICGVIMPLTASADEVKLRMNVVSIGGDSVALPVTKKSNGDVCASYVASSKLVDKRLTIDVKTYCAPERLVEGKWQPVGFKGLVQDRLAAKYLASTSIGEKIHSN